MKKRLLFLGILAFVVATSTKAGSIHTLTFEGLQNLEPVNNFYNGGLGGFGSGPGPNYGVTFGADTLAVIAQSAGGSGNFSGNPSGNTVAFFLSGPGDVMNVSGGFTTGFSFFYANTDFAGAVTVWSGLNGTGTELANISLPALGGCVNPPNYCDWAPAGVSFSGTAESAIFTGTANFIAFDNITLGSSSPTTPEPSSLILFGTSLLGLVPFRRKLFGR